jgi:major outer membrane protein
VIVLIFRNHNARALLYAGVSTLALVVASSEVGAADAPVLKAPPPAGRLTMFIEGAAFGTAGKPVWTEVPPPGGPFDESTAMRLRVGWEAAAGLDYQWWGSPWHVSAALRYGQARSRNKNFFQGRTCTTPGVCTSAAGTVKHREDHLVADFMVGRDVGLGVGGNGQVKFGVRIAKLTATTNGAGAWFCSYNGSNCNNASGNVASGVTFQQRSKFVGLGPRAALEASAPLGGGWAIDYGVGVAVLFGHRTLNLTGSGVDNSAGGLFTFASQFTNRASVLNLDASAGLAYWFTPAFKVTAGYRLDAYWNALTTFDRTAENTVNVDRIFHGPFVRATGQFGASDAPMIFKAPPSAGRITMWIEGGAFGTGGKPVWTEVPPFQGPFAESTAMKPRFGWQAAAGLDYQPMGSPWHISAALRHGQTKSRNKNFFQSFTSVCTPTCTSAAGTVKHREDHLVADFMVGRDVGLGVAGNGQVKLGVRIAKLTATTDGAGAWFCNGTGCASSNVASAVTFQQRSKFVGIGPRAALEASAPLGRGWAIDYGVGVAVLFGHRTLNLNGSGVDSSNGGLFAFNSQFTNQASVFNLDASAGLAYWFTPAFKVTAGYRLDGYWNALTTFDRTAENMVNVARIYHGPVVRATGQF